MEKVQCVLGWMRIEEMKLPIQAILHLPEVSSSTQDATNHTPTAVFTQPGHPVVSRLTSVAKHGQLVAYQWDVLYCA